MRPRLPGTTDRLSAATAVALAIAVLLLGVLARQSRVEARGHRDTVDRILTEYAHFAGWEFTTQARGELQGPTLRPLVGAFLGAEFDPQRGPPTLDRFAADITAEARACRCLTLGGLFYTMSLRDSVLHVLGPSLADEERRWLRDTLLGVARGARASGALVRGGPQPQPPANPPAGGQPAPSWRATVTAAAARGQSVALVPRDGRVMAFIHEFAPPRDADTGAIYGFTADADSLYRPIFERVMTRGRLLPPTVTRGEPVDSIITVRAESPAGHVFFAQGDAPGTGSHVATDSLGPALANVRVHVALRPAAAAGMPIGGLPPSRVPLLVAVLALVIGVVAILMVQMRRQAHLARLRTEFVSGVSHELRTPLAQIRLLAELLAMDKPDSQAERRQAARIIDQEARRLSHLVQNVLKFSGFGRAAPRATPVRLELAEELSQVVGTFLPLATAEGVEVRTELQPGIHALADPYAFRQVMINLLDNAVRYGGRDRVVTVTSGERDGAACVSVADQGPGVPEREQALIWEEYYRLERDAAAPRGGSGIGLAVVRELVRQQGGSVGVRNRVGGGAEFWVCLPLAHDPPAPAVPAPAHAEAGA
jgi:signal transduction histidine kinase